MKRKTPSQISVRLTFHQWRAVLGALANVQAAGIAHDSLESMEGTDEDKGRELERIDKAFDTISAAVAPYWED